jgi:hypothetical protein
VLPRGSPRDVRVIASLLDVLFGCWHSNYSFPLTAKTHNRVKAARATGTYVVCLDCGKEFPYCWKLMKVVTTSSPAPSGELVEMKVRK